MEKIRDTDCGFQYEDNGEIYEAIKADDLTLAEVNEDIDCVCGETKCVNGKRWRCSPLNDEGDCVWFITNQPC